MTRLHFVFLQGMPSAFFTRVARQLSAWGCKTTGINLCAGDSMFWRGRHTVNYRGSQSAWPAFLAGFFDAHHVTDLILLGEQRSYHKPAVDIAKARGIRVHVTDFGYLRPDWITLERDGMSGSSRFPRDPAQISEIAFGLPSVDLDPRYRDSSWNMAVGDLLYSFSNVFLFWLYPYYRRSDRRPHPLVYFPAIGRRLLLAWLTRRDAQERIASIKASGVRYFVFPLQLEHDFQIVAYSSFQSLEEAVRMVMRSFARHSGAGTRLVIKAHPWDPGLRNWERLVIRLSEEFDVRDRVDYLEGGNLDELISHSAGMVTVNSTSGLRALQLGSPVMPLGEAIYDVPGLTHQGELDGFWTECGGPDRDLVEAFIKAIAATIQIRGVFFREPGLSAAVNAAAIRLFNAPARIPVAEKTPGVGIPA
jgi:capsular polysaccharide export protein